MPSKVVWQPTIDGDLQTDKAATSPPHCATIDLFPQTLPRAAASAAPRVARSGTHRTLLPLFGLALIVAFDYAAYCAARAAIRALLP